MITGRLGTAILFLALVLSLRDIYGHREAEHDADADDEAFSKEFGDEEVKHDITDDEEIPVRKPSSHFTAPHTMKDLPDMNFQFCVSCGYRQAYDEFSKLVHDKYPTMKIEGHNYPPPFWKAVIAQVIAFSKIALIVLIIMGRDPFPSIGQPTPGIFTWALNNKLSSCLMIFLLSNTFESTLMSTGAFEIYLGKERVWSKLESGRVPTPPELIQIIDQHMEIQGTKIPETFSYA